MGPTRLNIGSGQIPVQEESSGGHGGMTAVKGMESQRPWGRKGEEQGLG